MTKYELDVAPLRGRRLHVVPGSRLKTSRTGGRGSGSAPTVAKSTPIARSKALIVDREHEPRHDFDLVVPTPRLDAGVSWFRERSLPLLSTEAGHGDGDLTPLKAAIGDPRVVALGEATHGTREFSQLMRS